MNPSKLLPALTSHTKVSIFLTGSLQLGLRGAIYLTFTSRYSSQTGIPGVEEATELCKVKTVRSLQNPALDLEQMIHALNKTLIIPQGSGPSVVNGYGWISFYQSI